MKISAIKCKTLLTKSNLPKVDYCINPYIGCSHACAYCYARFMRRFTGHSELWGQFLDIKMNAAEVLAKEMARKPKKGTILLGSVTDAYQSIERKCCLTRAVLEILVEYDWPISILTKSNLVMRDIDLLKRFSECEVGLTITTMDQKICRNFEPGSSVPQQRIEALETLHQNKIATYVFIGPILPELSDIEAIFKAIKGKADFVMAEALNLKCGNRYFIETVLLKEYPQLLPIYKKGFGKDYWDSIEKLTRKLAGEYGIHFKGFFRH